MKKQKLISFKIKTENELTAFIEEQGKGGYLYSITPNPYTQDGKWFMCLDVNVYSVHA